MSRRVITIAAIKAAPEETRSFLEHARGAANERRVLGAIQWFIRRHPNHWIRDVRPGTPDEDKAGGDLIVTSDEGDELWLQVKSSDAGWCRFVATPRSRPIGIVIVRDNDERVQLAEKAVEALRQVRAA